MNTEVRTFAPDYAKDEEVKRQRVVASECVVCASVLASAERQSWWFRCDREQLGPKVCTVLAHWPYFESVEARLVAEGLTKCIRKGWRLTRPNVARMMPPECEEWLDHPDFSDTNAIPLSCAESEAMRLLPTYRNKRLIEVVSRMHGMMKEKPDKARELCMDLKLKLEEQL
jgi:hypothetical protein